MHLCRFTLTLVVAIAALCLGACDREEPERPIIDPEQQPTDAQP